jgi:16S rRNA G966 N2-methylase RsmD
MGRTKKGRKALFCWLSIHMNVWNNFYQNIRDTSWPDCATENEFYKLPSHIQHEILTVFNGAEYLKLSESDVTKLPLTLPNTNHVSDFLLKFAVANDFFVHYDHNIEGGGIHNGQNYPRVLKYLYPDRTFEHCLEWAAGHGAIGFRLLADGICQKLHLVECDTHAVNACQKTINNMPNKFSGTVSITQTTTLSNLDSNLLFDLVVANPPTYNSIVWGQPLKDSMSLTDWKRISVDRDWQAHQDFFNNIKKHLKPNGVVLLQEQTHGSSVFEFEKFIDAGELKIVQAFVEKFAPTTWYLELTHK